jgi:hypothetical protein
LPLHSPDLQRAGNKVDLRRRIGGEGTRQQVSEIAFLQLLLPIPKVNHPSARDDRAETIHEPDRRGDAEPPFGEV